jgi:hypothetical protein
MSSILYRTIWSHFKGKLLAELYEGQITFWNHKLKVIIQKNARAATGLIISEAQAGTYAIQHGKTCYECLPVSWLKPRLPPERHFTLTQGAGLSTELFQVAEELNILKKERYESDRFISALTMYFPTRYQLRNIFGDTLYRTIVGIVQPLKNERDDIFQPILLEEFLEQNQYILNHMQERILVNLIMVDVTR